MVRKCNIDGRIPAIKEDSAIIIEGSNGGRLIIKEFRFSFKSSRYGSLNALNIRLSGMALVKSE